MSRTRWEDPLQDHLFWAMDISGDKSIPVFTPLFGFSGISAPKIQTEMETFKDGTYNYPRHVAKGGTVSPITFTRAASMYDSDFYDWIYYAIEGTRVAQSGPIARSPTGSVRRSLLVFHFARINLHVDGSSARASALNALAAGVEAAAFAGLAGASASTAGLIGASAGVLTAAGIGPFQFATWLPVRAWTLHGCIPTSYTSGTDFNASSGQVSLMNLEVQPEWVEQHDLGI